jgi:hypothetical protein
MSRSGERVRLPRWLIDVPADWSPDGGLLAGVSDGRVATMRPDGSGRRVLVDFRLSHTSPGAEYADCRSIGWRPGGKRLLVACGKSYVH